MSSDTGSEDSFQVVESMNPEAHRDSKMEGDSPVKTSPHSFPQPTHNAPPQSPTDPFALEAKRSGSEQKQKLASPQTSQSGTASHGSVDVNLSQSSGNQSPRGEETSSAPPDVSFYRQGFSELGSPSEHSEPSGLHGHVVHNPDNSPDASTLFQSIDAQQSFPQPLASPEHGQEVGYNVNVNANVNAEGSYVGEGEVQQAGMPQGSYGYVAGQGMDQHMEPMGDNTAAQLFGGEDSSGDPFQQPPAGQGSYMPEPSFQGNPAAVYTAPEQTEEVGVYQGEGFAEEFSPGQTAEGVFGNDTGFAAFPNSETLNEQDGIENDYSVEQSTGGIPVEFQDQFQYQSPQQDLGIGESVETTHVSPPLQDTTALSAASEDPFHTSDHSASYTHLQSSLVSEDTTEGPPAVPITRDQASDAVDDSVQVPKAAAEPYVTDGAGSNEAPEAAASPTALLSPPPEEKGSPSVVPGFDNLRVDTAPPGGGGGAGLSPVPAAANLFGSSSAASGSPLVSKASTPRSGGTPTASTLFASATDETQSASEFASSAPAEALFESDRSRQKSISSAASDFFDGIDESKKLGGNPEQAENTGWQSEQQATHVQAQMSTDYQYPPVAEGDWQEQPSMPTAMFQGGYNALQTEPQPQHQHQQQPQADVYSSVHADSGAYLEPPQIQQNFAPEMQGIEGSYAPVQSQTWQQDPFQYAENPSAVRTDPNQQAIQPTYDVGQTGEASGASHPFSAEQVGSKSPVEYGIEFAPALPMMVTQMPNTAPFTAEAPVAAPPIASLPPMAPQPSDASMRSGGESTSLYGERRNDGKPPHAVVSWGFGGRLLVMVPMERMKLKPQLITRGSRDGSSDNMSVPRRESISSMAESVDSENYGSGQGRRRLRKGQVRMFSMRMLMGCSKHVPCWDGSEITAFPGPLRGPKSAFHEVDAFLESKLLTGLRFNDGELIGSTQLLWYVLKLYVGGAGDMQREDIVRQIVNVLRTGAIQLDGNNSLQIFHEDADGHDAVLPPTTPPVDAAVVQAQIQELLLGGDREGAVVHAVENELWTEALIISNFVSASAYRKVVTRFADKSLLKFSATRAVFRLFAGQGDEMVSEQSMDKEQLRGSWREVLACIMSNRTPGDTTVLQLLGDRLWLELGSVSAAHVCYLLAGVPVHASGRSRIVLVGGDHKSCLSQKLCVVSAAIQMTEVYLYARQLGDSQYGLAPFQGYRLVYAMWLADIGYTEEALHWVESIQEAVDMCVKQTQEPGKLGIGSGFQRQLKIFGDRLKFVGNGYPGSRKQMEAGETPSFMGKFARFFGQPDANRGGPSAHGRGSPDHQPTPLQFKPSHTDPFAKPFTRPVRTDKEPEPAHDRNAPPPFAAPPARDDQLSTAAPTLEQEQLGAEAIGFGMPQQLSNQAPGPFQSGGLPPGQAPPMSAPPMPPPIQAPAENMPPGDANKGKEAPANTSEEAGKADESGGSMTTSLFKGLKTITQKIYKPKGHVVDGGMGSDMKAVFDPVKGQWIFPDDPGISKEEKQKQEKQKAGPPVMAKGPVASLSAPGRPSTAPPVGGNQFRIMPPAGRGKGRRDLSKIRYVDPFKAMKQGNS